MKIGKTTICAADIDRDKFQISELDPIQNLKKKKKKKKKKKNDDDNNNGQKSHTQLKIH